MRIIIEQGGDEAKLTVARAARIVTRCPMYINFTCHKSLIFCSIVVQQNKNHYDVLVLLSINRGRGYTQTDNLAPGVTIARQLRVAS